MASSGSEEAAAQAHDRAGVLPPAERPRIGLTTYRERARWGVWEQQAVLLPHSYVSAVHGAGGVPVLLPPLPDGADVALAGVDGLVVSGGADIDPAAYGAEPLDGNDQPRPDRDAWEAALLGSALRTGVPVLGVCRGAQVINVASGGTLHQHLPDVVGNTRHRRAVAQHGRVGVQVLPGSTLASVLGPRAEVPCYHHQAIDRLGEGLRATAWADDGTIEAVEMPGPQFVLGVQWHPEIDPHDPRLFAALVAAATARRVARRTAQTAGPTSREEP